MRCRFWHGLLVMLVCTALASCASVAARPAALPHVIRDTVWYVSARARVDGKDRRALSDSLKFGAAIFERRTRDDPFTGSVGLVLRDSVTVSRSVFEEALRRRTVSLDAPDDFAVHYVHGFGTSLHECWLYAAQARLRSTASGDWVPFCWPSHGAGITWPTWGSIFVRAYHEDVRSLISSRALFAESLRVLTQSIGASRTVLVSHSLGARLVAGALQADTVLSRELRASPLRALTFMAPDVSAALFADTLLPQLAPLATRTVLYSSRNDRALRISRAIHDAERAGLRTNPAVLSSAVELVDITEGYAVEGWFARRFGNRHKITRSAAMLFDLGRVVGAGYAPSCRTTALYARGDSLGVWHLLRDQRPRADSLAVCERMR